MTSRPWSDEQARGQSIEPTSVVKLSPARLAGRKSTVPMNWATNRVAGRWKIRSGGSVCSMRPPFITAMRSPTNRASCWSWVTKMVVVPVARMISKTSRRTCSLSFGSRLEKGSSSSSTSGCGARARPKATRCCCPPDSSWGIRLRKPYRPTSPSTSLTIPSRPLSRGSP